MLPGLVTKSFLPGYRHFTTSYLFSFDFFFLIIFLAEPFLVDAAAAGEESLQGCTLEEFVGSRFVLHSLLGSTSCLPVVMAKSSLKCDRALNETRAISLCLQHPIQAGDALPRLPTRNLFSDVTSQSRAGGVQTQTLARSELNHLEQSLSLGWW